VLGRKLVYVRFEVFTAVAVKNGIFWDVTPCGFCKEPYDVTSQKTPFFEVGLDINVGSKYTCMLLSHNQNTGQNRDIKIADIF
jgi:hypothetical protein